MNAYLREMLKEQINFHSSHHFPFSNETSMLTGTQTGYSELFSIAGTGGTLSSPFFSDYLSMQMLGMQSGM